MKNSPTRMLHLQFYTMEFLNYHRSIQIK